MYAFEQHFEIVLGAGGAGIEFYHRGSCELNPSFNFSYCCCFLRMPRVQNFTTYVDMVSCLKFLQVGVFLKKIICIQFLIFFVSSLPQSGWTAMTDSAAYGRADCVCLLLENGADKEFTQVRDTIILFQFSRHHF